MNQPEPLCPARTFGRVADCRWCIYTPGGAPSALCLKLRAAWERDERKKREREQMVDTTDETRSLT